MRENVGSESDHYILLANPSISALRPFYWYCSGNNVEERVQEYHAQWLANSATWNTYKLHSHVRQHQAQITV